jgi:nucleotide-binding universal stress UspA family protein
MVVPKKILLATDGSAESAHAADMAVGLSNGLGSELHVVHVGHVPSVYMPPGSRVLDPEEFRERMRESVEGETREKLEEEARKIKEAGGEVTDTHTRFGKVDKEIVHLAEELGADLVILGSRGSDPIKRAVMGSVSDSVVRYAHCPVLVVR